MRHGRQTISKAKLVGVIENISQTKKFNFIFTISLMQSCLQLYIKKDLKGLKMPDPLPLLTRAVECCAFIATQEEEGFASRCVLHSPIVRACNTSYHIVTHCACNTDPLWSTTVGNGYYQSLKFTWAPTRILPARRLVIRLFFYHGINLVNDNTSSRSTPWTRKYQSDWSIDFDSLFCVSPDSPWLFMLPILKTRF